MPAPRMWSGDQFGPIWYAIGREDRCPVKPYLCRFSRHQPCRRAGLRRTADLNLNRTWPIGGRPRKDASAMDMRAGHSDGLDKDGVESAYAWRRLFLALALGTIGGIGLWSTVVVLPYVQAEFGVARGGASLPYTAT